MVRAPYDNALQHAVQRGIKLQVRGSQRDLALPPRDKIAAEHLDRARHVADLVQRVLRGYVDRRVAVGEFAHGFRHGADLVADRPRT